MIKTLLSTMIGGAGIWTPGATTIGAFGTKKTFNQLIKSLFANNEQGFAYDPNDLSTMYQDAAGIVPVTGVGQPVGLILDKSGRGNHARQTNSTSRPLLQRNATTGAYYLAFDGADDFLVTNNIDFTATDKISLFAGVTSNPSTARILLETSDISTSTAGAFGLYVPHTANNARLQDFKSALRAINSTNNSLVAGQYVLSAKLSQIEQLLRLNEVEFLGATVSTGNYGNYPLYIGRRGGTSIAFDGHIYGLIGIGRLTTNAETVALERLIAKNTGVTLSV